MENNQTNNKQQKLLHRRRGSLEAWIKSQGICTLAKLVMLALILMLETVRAGQCGTPTFSAGTMADIIVYVAYVSSESTVNGDKNLRQLTWTNTASGCNPGLNAVTYSYKVLEYDSWVTLSSTTFDQNYDPYYDAMTAGTGTNSRYGYFNFASTLPTNALMKQLPEIVFKFQLTASAINFSDSSNWTCASYCNGITYWSCPCANTLAVNPASYTTTFTVTWKNVCLGEVFVLPQLQEDIVY